MVLTTETLDHRHAREGEGRRRRRPRPRRRDGLLVRPSLTQPRQDPRHRRGSLRFHGAWRTVATRRAVRRSASRRAAGRTVPATRRRTARGPSVGTGPRGRSTAQIARMASPAHVELAPSSRIGHCVTIDRARRTDDRSARTAPRDHRRRRRIRIGSRSGGRARDRRTPPAARVADDGRRRQLPSCRTASVAASSRAVRRSR